MSIKFGKAEFGTVKKQESAPVERPIPDVLPPWNPNPPHILTEIEGKNCFGNLNPMHARFNQNSHIWESFSNVAIKSTPSISLNGENFIESANGLYQSKDGETQGKKISSATLAITKIERRWSGKTIEEILHVKVSYSDKQGTDVIKVPKGDFKKIFEKIRQNLLDAYTSAGDLDAKEEYLTKIYQRDAPTADVEYLSDIGGWVEFKDVPPKFYVGEDSFYDDMKIDLPNVNHLNWQEIFVEGSKFREIGHQNGVIEILWIVAHIALSLFRLRQFGVDFRSVIFLKGKTNLSKQR